MSIHRDGETKQTKLDSISKLSRVDKTIKFNNLGHIIDLPMLRELYYQLDGNKAIGIDGVSKEEYGKSLDENLKNLILRIRRGQYKPKAARLVEIPKEDGSTRPLAISCLEDKLVQSAVNVILNKIYEPLFLNCSYGFRPGKNCHDALKALNKATFKYWDGSVVEIDLKKCFNSISHDKLMECLGKKITDKRFLKLIRRLLKTPTKVGDQTIANDCGSPQCSIVSPILANIYLHEVIDTWFEQLSKSHFKGKAEMVRYCDDMVFIFQNRQDAERFYKVLPKRLDKYELALNVEKSQMIESGHLAAYNAEKQGERLPTYKFLGFTCYWGKSRKGQFRLKYTSRKDRFTSKLKGLRKYLWDNLNTKNTMELLNIVKRVVRGWINYHGISDNGKRVNGFIQRSKQILFAWFNRRGGNEKLTWERYMNILARINYPVKWKVVSMFS